MNQEVEMVVASASMKSNYPFVELLFGCGCFFAHYKYEFN
jgi:hypothetical protein